MKTVFGCILFAFVLISCGPERLTEEEINAYMTDPSNGLLKEDSVNAVKIEVQNRPVALIVAQELRGETVVNDSVQKTITDKFSGNLYFNLTLSVQDKDPLLYSGSMSRFSSLLQTMAFQMNKYVVLTTSEKDTIPVADFVYPRLYGMGRGSSVLFAFSREGMKPNTKWIDFHLLEFGMNTGNRTYRFDMDDLEGAPLLKAEPKPLVIQ